MNSSKPVQVIEDCRLLCQFLDPNCDTRIEVISDGSPIELYAAIDNHNKNAYAPFYDYIEVYAEEDYTILEDEEE